MLAMIMTEGNPLDHVVQHPLLQREASFGFLTPEGQVTLLSDHIAMLITAGLLLILFVPSMVRRRRGTDPVGSLVPAGSGNLIEAICSYLREEIARPNLHQHTDRFIRYIWSVFFFILTVNLLGLLPIPAISQLFGTHLGGAATGNIWTTATLAILTLVLMVVNGIRYGGRHYFAHFMPGPIWLAPMMVVIEVAGLFAKIFALTVRLFANMLAGHVLLGVLLGFIATAVASLPNGLWIGIAVPAILGSVAINLLEIFVAFLQAFIFAFLTTLFIGQSVVFHHEGKEDAHAH